MRKPSIAPLVYARLFPAPKATDPPTFQAHLSRNIVQEVRAEISCYYGPTDCLEAQYPGLDYANPAHRSRLSRFTFHRRLFRAFDELRLTGEEIRELCRWEGTRFAREKYEEQHHCQIRDTTWDDVEVEELRQASAVKTYQRGGEVNGTPLNGSLDDGRLPENEGGVPDDGGTDEEDSEDELHHSVGVDLNRHLLAATAARARGEQVVLDADWEQWLKEAAERGASEATSLAGVGSTGGLSSNPGSYGQQALFRSNPQQQIVNAPQYNVYSPAASSASQAGTAM